jgi:flagellar basal-body rod modification protein FlgD
MSSIAATSTNPATLPTDNPTARVAQKTLGQSDFLKLLTTQMSNQDPMNPISDTSQIAQLAQFSSLQSMNSLLTNSQLEGASNLIGKSVTLNDSNDGTVSGTVDSAMLNSGTVYVTVNGTPYAYTEIALVKAAAAATTPSSP